MLIIGHRGCNYKGYNQNTIRAYNKVVSEGAKAIEIDVQLTKDNHIIVIHNLNLSKITTGDGLVIEKTIDEIRSIHAGNPPEGANDLIPELYEVLDFLVSLNIEKRPVLHLELKGDNTGIPTGLLIKNYLSNQKLIIEDFLISSFNWNELISIRNILPNIKIALLDGSIHRKPLLSFVKNHQVLFSKIFNYGEEDYMIPKSTDIIECYKFYEKEIVDKEVLEIIKNEVKKCLTGDYYNDSLIDTALKMKAYSINLWFNTVSKEYIEKAHKKGLKVFLYTVNIPSDLDKLVDLKPDGIFTDYYIKTQKYLNSLEYKKLRDFSSNHKVH